MIGVGYLLDEVDGLSRRSHFLWCKYLLHRRESFYLNNTSCYLFLERACLEDEFSSFRNLFSK
ncbi:Uncharacterised protein [Segatella copri]|nr:Uncharacterised protein [Segatella copri]